MSNLDFTNLRRIIINNVEDDRTARDLILKITDMEMVKDMRKEVINSIDDLDVLNEVLKEIQLCELLVPEDEDEELFHVDKEDDPAETRRQIMRSILRARAVELHEDMLNESNEFISELKSSGGYEGLFSNVKPLN